MSLLDDWEAAKRAPEPVVVARKSASETGLDLLLAREEFGRASESIQSGAARVSESGVDRRAAGQIASGVGLGLGTAATFVFPWGRGGQLAMGGARVARAGALRAAAGLSDEAFDAAAAVGGPRARRVTDALVEDLQGAGVPLADRTKLLESFEPLGEMGRAGGFTWNPRTAQNQFKKGYSVAVVPGYTAQVPVEQFDSMKVLDYLRLVPEGESLSVAQRLAANPRNMVGAWVEPIDGVDHVWMDISTVLPNKDAALRIGGARGEIGVYDFSLGEFGDTLYLRDFPDYLPGGRKYTPDALARYGFEEPTGTRIPVGKWVEESTAQLVPRRLLEPFREFKRSGERVDDLIPQIRERGFDDPIILEVDPNGRALISEGNHRIEAARIMGVEEIPVRVFGRTAGSLDGRGAPVSVRPGVEAGYLLLPSDAVNLDVLPAPSMGLTGLAGGGRVADLTLPPSLLRPEGGVFEASLSGVKVRELGEELAQRHIDSPQGLAGVDPRDIATALNEIPEWDNFIRVFREQGPTRRPGTLQERRGELMEFARMTGLKGPRGAGPDTPELSLELAMGKRGTMPAARNLGVRIRNLSVAATDDVFNASFYVDFNRAISEVSARTGMPVMVISTALASASARANPYTELTRLLKVAREVRLVNGRAYAPSIAEIRAKGRGNSVFWPVTSDNPDNFLITTARGLADSINNPNFLDTKVSGIAAKTLPYAYLRYDPTYWLGYVADTVDGLGQFMFRGSAINTADGISAIQNQLAGRILANIYGVKPSDMQEALWAYVRIMRDAFGAPLEGGGFRSVPIAPAFTGSAGDATTVLNNAIDSMDPRLVQLARSNYEQKFVPDVRSGKARGWEWDGDKPVIASDEFLIPPENRVTPRAQKIQRASLELVEAAGENLKARLLSLAATAGISADLLIRSTGDVLSNLPLGARVGAGAGALLGATQSPASADNGSVTLGAAPIAGAGGAAVGAAAGLLAGGLTSAAKAGLRVLGSPAAQRVLSTELAEQAISDGLLNVGYRPGVAKSYSSIDNMAERLFVPGRGGEIPLTEGMVNEALLHTWVPEENQAKSLIEKIVREEVQGLMHLPPISEPVLGSGNLTRYDWSRKVAEELFETSKKNSRWLSDSDVLPRQSVNYFDYATGFDDFAPEISRKFSLVVDRYNEIVEYRTLQRIMQEVPEYAENLGKFLLVNPERRFALHRIPLLHSAIKETVPVVNVPIRAFESVFKDGMFLNQYVSRTSKGTLDPVMRTEREWFIKNIPLSAPASERPVYGYFAFPDLTMDSMQDRIARILSGTPVQAGSETLPAFGLDNVDGYFGQFFQRWLRMRQRESLQYGEIAVVLKPSVLDDATFTLTDSLGGTALASPFRNFSEEDLIFSGARRLTFSSGMVDDYMARYAEGQFNIVGKPLEDVIDYFVVSGSSTIESSNAQAAIRRLMGDRFEVRFTDWA